jgi:PKHD-type hydroxylase
MNLKNYYWYFKSALSDKFCDDLIAYGKQQQDQLALTGELSKKEITKLTKKEIKDLKKSRNSNVAWLSDRWIYDAIQPFVNQANANAGWNVQWDWSEACQFTKYSPGQFYDWHCDSWLDPYNSQDPNINGKIRKLSVTCSLSDPKDYKGGELEFSFRDQNPEKKEKLKICSEIKPRGSIVVFPSFVWHRVKPVTKGTRYSLVIWNLGHPYK